MEFERISKFYENFKRLVAYYNNNVSELIKEKQRIESSINILDDRMDIEDNNPNYDRVGAEREYEELYKNLENVKKRLEKFKNGEEVEKYSACVTVLFGDVDFVKFLTEESIDDYVKINEKLVEINKKFVEESKTNLVEALSNHRSAMRNVLMEQMKFIESEPVKSKFKSRLIVR